MADDAALLQRSEKAFELVRQNRIKYLKLRQLIESGDQSAEEVGQELATLGILEIAAELPPSYDADVCQLIERHFYGATQFHHSLWRQEIRQYRNAKIPRAEKGEKAVREDYFEFYEHVLGTIKRDMFSDELVYKDGDIWQPVLNRLSKLRSEALAIEENGGKFYAPTAIEIHLEVFSEGKRPELCVEIPPWDGVDRIAKMAQCLVIARNEASIDNEVAYDLIRAFLTRMFARLDNPKIQNPVLTLQGPKRLGKDTWLSTLVDGLGQFARPMGISVQERDLYLQLHQGMVLKIPEMDRISRWESNTLKDLIFKESTSYRGAYERTARLRPCHCSFVASFNPALATVMSDAALAARFWIFPVKNIIWEYETGPKAELQILAQGQQLYRDKYKPSSKSLEKMSEYLDMERAEMIHEEIIDVWFSLVEKQFPVLPPDRYSLGQRMGKLRSEDVDMLLSKVASMLGLRPHRLSAELKAAKIKNRDMHAMYYFGDRALHALHVSGEKLQEQPFDSVDEF